MNHYAIKMNDYSTTIDIIKNMAHGAEMRPGGPKG